MSDIEPDPVAVSEPPIEVDVALLSRIEGELADVARAMERLDEGSYGTCEACGAALPDERLAVAPAARFCTDHEPAIR